MNKLKLTSIVKSVQASMIKHKPEILLGFGIATGVSATVFAATETPKALRLIEDARKEKGEDLTTVEKAKACWKCYIPAAVATTVSVSCLIGANSVSARRTAALAAAYQISETALSEYREKVIETIGEKKEQIVRDNIAKSHIEKKPVSQSQVIVTNKGKTLCFDELAGRYFESDIDKIKAAQNDFNRDLLSEMYKSLNEFYDALEVPHIGIGDDIGWNVEKGFMDIAFSSHLADDGTPCIVIGHRMPPTYNYNKIV